MACCCSVSCVQLFATLWTAACQSSLSITNSQSLLKLMSTELVMSSNNLILCHPLLLLPSIFPASESFQMSQHFATSGQSFGVSYHFSISSSNEYSGLTSFKIDWFNLFAVQRIDSQESSPAPQFKNIISSVFSLLCGSTLTSILDYRKNHSFD